MSAPYWVVKAEGAALRFPYLRVLPRVVTWVGAQRLATRFATRAAAVAAKAEDARVVRVVPKRSWPEAERVQREVVINERLDRLEAQVRSLQLAQPRGIKHASDKA